MVIRKDKREVPEFTRQVALAVKGLMAERGLTQTQVGNALSRSQAYVSERVNGADAWSTADLDKVARMLGFRDGFDLLDEVKKRSGN